MRSKTTWSALVAVLAAAVAIMLVGAAGASAAVCEESIRGEGASLQRVAQLEWITLYEPLCTRTETTVTYEPSGSGAGLAAWNAEGGAERTISRSRDHWISTDDAPTVTQERNIARSANSQPIATIPVVAAAVSIIARPPAGCTLTLINNADLEGVYRGTISRWSGLSNTNGAGSCERTIGRVVRSDVSGTTYQLKHYLWYIHSTRDLGNLGAERPDWLEIQTGTRNTQWPSTTERPARTGGGAIAASVAERENTIGYVALADAKAAGLTPLQVQNNGTTSPATWTNPATAERGSFCARTTYRRNLGREATIEPTLATNYEAIYGSNPNSGTAYYPICTLTWAVVTLNYERAGYTERIGRSVREYMRYITDEAQQNLSAGRWYSSLPAAWVEAGGPLDAIAERIR